MIELLYSSFLSAEIQSMILNYISPGPIMSWAVMRGETARISKDIHAPDGDLRQGQVLPH